MVVSLPKVGKLKTEAVGIKVIFFFKLFILFIYFCLCWVLVAVRMGFL